MESGMRIDKWMWAVRLFKTRSRASLACRTGKVRMNGQTVKPSRMIKEGDILTLARTRFTMTIRIQALPQQRVGAPLVSQYLEDLTPPDEYQKREQVQELDFEIRDQGTGRPTKRNRREIERLKRLL